jgi:hypothetical protein
MPPRGGDKKIRKKTAYGCKRGIKYFFGPTGPMPEMVT